MARRRYQVEMEVGTIVRSSKSFAAWEAPLILRETGESPRKGTAYATTKKMGRIGAVEKGDTMELTRKGHKFLRQLFREQAKSQGLLATTLDDRLARLQGV
jgi:hypothetical protein